MCSMSILATQTHPSLPHSERTRGTGGEGGHPGGSLTCTIETSCLSQVRAPAPELAVSTHLQVLRVGGEARMKWSAVPAGDEAAGPDGQRELETIHRRRAPL
jgi:hypothetical protein